ncbi:MAG: PAS domain-containing protein [Rhodospirillales bacterium]|nr:PAS domain-containing protein [Alphaproteobacteria bacterium]MCB9987535.1 PAS domain-containing protein [Rhodospirillales bacterium]USO07742.1 MAG: PAS domain-containing protein [Rhodospirillales bacterium]
MLTAATSSASDPRRNFLRRAALYAAWFERHALGNTINLLLLILTLVMGVVTYRAMTAHSGLAGNVNRLILLLNIDLVVLLLLIVGIARRVVRLWAVRRQGVAGSALQARLVGLFSALVAFPAIITAVFSVGLFYYGVHGWFDTRVRAAVNESLEVARAYLNEHQQVLRADVEAMAADLNRDNLLLAGNSQALEKMLAAQSYLRNFSEAIVFDSNRRVLGQSGIALSMIFNPVPDEMLDRARAGDVAMETGENDDQIRALVRLNGFGDGTYLYVGRSVDPQVLSHLDMTRAAVSQYQELAAKSTRIQLSITLLYVAVVLLLMAVAVWFGLVLARRMVDPIGAVIMASERLRAGDMSARVGETRGLEEFVNLGRAFNRMTQEIERQRNELIEANQRLDYRRRFTETVLGGVSTGIMGIDADGTITLANPAAGDLLGTSHDRLVGQKLAAVIPDAAGVEGEQEIAVMRRDGASRKFLVRASTELVGEAGRGTILAFDDITDRLAAQKSAAWADVARRIAHEIKNPLTPIQLSAERIKRKYLGHLSDAKDRDVLEKCTDTIVRHVEDIKTMVNAFAGFAKMPDPVLAPIDLLPLVQEVLALQSAANSKVAFDLRRPDFSLRVLADQQLVRQALTNLVQNAVDATADQAEPKIGLFFTEDRRGVWMGVLDNGPGIPPARRAAVLEPYVTTKAKGTGLGLAIVKKIAEDHGGRIAMDDPALMPEAYTGAHFWLYIPKEHAAHGEPPSMERSA